MMLCLQPLDNGGQRLVRFEIETKPHGSLSAEKDPFGNTRHVLNVHPEHAALEIAAQSTVRPARSSPLPPGLGADAWKEIDAWRDSFLHWDFTQPSAMATPSSRARRFHEKKWHRARERPARGPDPAVRNVAQRVSIYTGKHIRRVINRRNTKHGPGSLPGLRPRHDRGCPLLGRSRPLRLGLSLRSRFSRRSGLE